MAVRLEAHLKSLPTKNAYQANFTNRSEKNALWCIELIKILACLYTTL
jgi:hypothetical protein